MRRFVFVVFLIGSNVLRHDIVCGIGCTQCADSNGDCITCKSGLTQNTNDGTQCVAPTQTNANGVQCPSASFNSNGVCTPCSPECQTCTAGTSNDCIICGNGKVSFNGSCVGTDGNGVCSGTKLIANNNKHACDSTHKSLPRKERISDKIVSFSLRT